MLMYMPGVLEKVVATGQLCWLRVATSLLCQLHVMALCNIVSWVTGVCWWLSKGWTWGTGGVLNDVVDAVAEVTVDVLLALISFLTFFSAFFFALHVFCRMFGFSTECAPQFLLTRCRTELCTMIFTFTFPASYLFMTAHCGGIFLTTLLALLNLLLRLNCNQLWSCRCCYICCACYTCDLWKRYLHRWNLGHSLTYR